MNTIKYPKGGNIFDVKISIHVDTQYIVAKIDDETVVVCIFPCCITNNPTIQFNKTVKVIGRIMDAVDNKEYLLSTWYKPIPERILKELQGKRILYISM